MDTDTQEVDKKEKEKNEENEVNSSDTETSKEGEGPEPNQVDDDSSTIDEIEPSMSDITDTAPITKVETSPSKYIYNSDDYTLVVTHQVTTGDLLIFLALFVLIVFKVMQLVLGRRL